MTQRTRLLYVATLAGTVPAAQELILKAAMARLAVTGTLVCLPPDILGALEGTRPAVLEAYAVLADHTSHRAPEIIEVEDVDTPEFPDWGIIRSREE